MIKGWNKYFLRTLDRAGLTRIMMYDARNETQWVRNTTRTACQNCPNLTEAQKEDQLALEEDIEL